MQKYILVKEDEMTEIKNKLDILIKRTTTTSENGDRKRETISIKETRQIYGYSYQYWRNKVKKENVLKNYGVGTNILLSTSELAKLMSPKTA